MTSPKGHHQGLGKPWETPHQSQEGAVVGQSGWEGLGSLGLLGKDLDIGDLGSGHVSSWQGLSRGAAPPPQSHLGLPGTSHSRRGLGS